MLGFVLTCYMHSEKLEDQKRGIVNLETVISELSVGVEPESAAGKAVGGLKNVKQYSQAHLDIVAKWGRFPHRNASIGRESTPEEAAGLADGSIKGF
ncbi:hypothetical protein FOA52_011919 [Chlamydomonas sp. UWO 241]|nr:hypothetical protein FOA52_011919 [Chlamydomonas sp. UWO 241]